MTSPFDPSRRWIAIVIPLALLLLLYIDEPPSTPDESFVRRSLQSDDDGEAIIPSVDQEVADAAIEAADQAVGLSDRIVADESEEIRQRNRDSTKALMEAAQDLLVEIGEFQQQQHHHHQEGEGDYEGAITAPTQQRAVTDGSSDAPESLLARQQETAASSVESSTDDKSTYKQRRKDDPPPQPIQSREKYFGKIFPETNHVDMPFYLRNTFEPSNDSTEGRDIIFFWHVPKTGGQLVKNIMGMCFGLIRAEKLKDPASLEMVHDVIVNIDTSSPEGIAEAHELGLVDSNMVDFLSSSFVLSASSLFTPQHRGRAFTILRHPIDAAASNFYDRRVKHPELRGKYTLAQYVSKNYFVDNWVTRQLTGTLPHEELTRAHVDRAKNILAAKFFVGIYEHMDETMRQLKAFYRWKALEGEEYCVTDLIHGSNPKFQKTFRAKPARGSNDWAFVANVEKWDFELYYFALEAFSKQGRIWNAEEYSLIEMGRG